MQQPAPPNPTTAHTSAEPSSAQVASSPAPHPRWRWLWAGLIALSLVAWGAGIFVISSRPTQTIVLPPITQEELQTLTPAALPNMCLQDEGRARIAQWRAAFSGDARAQLDVLLFTSGCFDLLSAEEQRAFVLQNTTWILPQAESAGFPLDTTFLFDLLTSDTAPWSARQFASTELLKRLEKLSADERTRLLTTASTFIEHPWALDIIDAFGEPAATPLLWEHHKRITALIAAEEEAAKAAAKKKKDPPPKKPKPKKDAAPTPSDPQTDLPPPDEQPPDEQPPDEKPPEPTITKPPPPLAVYTPARLLTLIEARLMKQWRALPEDARTFFMLRQWLEARWVMHKSGSITQLQPLMLEVKWKGFDLPGPLADSVLWMRALTVTVDDWQKRKHEPEEAILPDGPARDLLGAHIFDEPTHWRRAVNMQPILKEKGIYKIAAAVELVLLPAEARGQVLTDDTGALAQSWRDKALWSHTKTLPTFTYKTYLGVDSGSPKTMREPKIGRQITQRLDVRLRTESGEVILREAGKNKKHGASTVYPYRHAVGNVLVLEATGAIDTHLSFRLHGLPNNDPKLEWMDLGGGVLMEGDTDGVWPVNLSPVCPLVGRCKVALRLRASLKTARPDPRIDKYWGDNVELGVLDFEISNSGDTRHWVELQKGLTGALGLTTTKPSAPAAP